MKDRCRDCDLNFSGTCPVHPIGTPLPAGTWSNRHTEPLTPKSFAEGVRRMLEQGERPMEPRRVLVGARAYDQAQKWRADPRYKQWDDSTLALSAQHGLDPLTMKPEDFLWVWHNAQYA